MAATYSRKTSRSTSPSSRSSTRNRPRTAPASPAAKWAGTSRATPSTKYRSIEQRPPAGTLLGASRFILSVAPLRGNDPMDSTTVTADVNLAIGDRRLHAKLTVPAGKTRLVELLPLAQNLANA